MPYPFDSAPVENYPFDSAPVQKAEIIEVIHVFIWRGTEESESDPLRPVYQYWTKDGRLLAEFDEKTYSHS